MVPAGLGDSDVILKEDVLKRPVDFVMTWLEYAAQNLEQIVRSEVDFIGAGEIILFDVPVKSTLFITSVWLSVDGSGQTSATSRITVNPRQLHLIGMNQSGVASARVNASPTMNFSMPIKVNGGENVSLVVAGIHEASGGFIGFLVPKRIA